MHTISAAPFDVKAVLARHSQLLAAQAGTAEKDGEEWETEEEWTDDEGAEAEEEDDEDDDDDDEEEEEEEEEVVVVVVEEGQKR
jgi:hypothetical protein